ncbi:MAG: hypothetical protein ACTHJ3_02775 [Pararhizobium sp.]
MADIAPQQARPVKPERPKRHQMVSRQIGRGPFKKKVRGASTNRVNECVKETLLNDLAR